MRAEPWPITCRARSRSRVPPASMRARGPVTRVIGTTTAVLLVTGGRGSSRGRTWWRCSCQLTRLGLVIGTVLAGSARGVQGPGDLLVAEPGLTGGDRQGTEVGGLVGVECAVGGPEQRRVAVSLGLTGHPPSQVGQVEA